MNKVRNPFGEGIGLGGGKGREGEGRGKVVGLHLLVQEKTLEQKMALRGGGEKGLIGQYQVDYLQSVCRPYH